MIFSVQSVVGNITVPSAPITNVNANVGPVPVAAGPAKDITKESWTDWTKDKISGIESSIGKLFSSRPPAPAPATATATARKNSVVKEMQSGRSQSVVGPIPERVQAFQPADSDTRGKHRILAELKRLEQESRFLEEELEQIERMEKASGACKEMLSNMETTPDPLLPM
ncbi:hypothetical protein V6N13_040722 [Hibiscus sabdariffa]